MECETARNFAGLNPSDCSTAEIAAVLGHMLSCAECVSWRKALTAGVRGLGVTASDRRTCRRILQRVVDDKEAWAVLEKAIKK